MLRQRSGTPRAFDQGAGRDFAFCSGTAALEDPGARGCGHGSRPVYGVSGQTHMLAGCTGGEPGVTWHRARCSQREVVTATGSAGRICMPAAEYCASATIAEHPGGSQAPGSAATEACHDLSELRCGAAPPPLITVLGRGGDCRALLPLPGLTARDGWPVHPRRDCFGRSGGSRSVRVPCPARRPGRKRRRPRGWRRLSGVLGALRWGGDTRGARVGSAGARSAETGHRNGMGPGPNAAPPRRPACARSHGRRPTPCGSRGGRCCGLRGSGHARWVARPSCGHPRAGCPAAARSRQAGRRRRRRRRSHGPRRHRGQGAA